MEEKFPSIEMDAMRMATSSGRYQDTSCVNIPGQSPASNLRGKAREFRVAHTPRRGELTRRGMPGR